MLVQENLANTYNNVSTLLVSQVFLWCFRTRWKALTWFLSHARNNDKFLAILPKTNNLIFINVHWFLRYGTWRADWRILWIYISIYRMSHNRMSVAQERLSELRSSCKVTKWRLLSLHRSVGFRLHWGFNVLRWQRQNLGPRHDFLTFPFQRQFY